LKLAFFVTFEWDAGYTKIYCGHRGFDREWQGVYYCSGIIVALTLRGAWSGDVERCQVLSRQQMDELYKEAAGPFFKRLLFLNFSRGGAWKPRFI
jgi:hypothetical protein